MVEVSQAQLDLILWVITQRIIYLRVFQGPGVSMENQIIELEALYDHLSKFRGKEDE